MTTSLPDISFHQLASFNGLDWILILVLAWSVIVALFRGLTREIFGLAGTILGLLLACWNYPALALRLSPWITSPIGASSAAFLLIAVGTLVVCTLLGRIIRTTAHTVGLGVVDRLAGAVFGVFRGALLGLCIVVAAIALFPLHAAAQNSRLAPYFLAAAREVSFVVPQDLQRRITGSIDGIRHIARR